MINFSNKFSDFSR